MMQLKCNAKLTQDAARPSPPFLTTLSKQFFALVFVCSVIPFNLFFKFDKKFCGNVACWFSSIGSFSSCWNRKKLKQVQLWLVYDNCFFLPKLLFHPTRGIQIFPFWVLRREKFYGKHSFGTLFYYSVKFKIWLLVNNFLNISLFTTWLTEISP